MTMIVSHAGVGPEGPPVDPWVGQVKGRFLAVAGDTSVRWMSIPETPVPLVDRGPCLWRWDGERWQELPARPAAVPLVAADFLEENGFLAEADLLRDAAAAALAEREACAALVDSMEHPDFRYDGPSLASAAAAIRARGGPLP